MFIYKLESYKNKYGVKRKMKNGKFLMVLFIVAALLLTTKAALGDVYINEFLSDPSVEDEWIELYNDDPNQEVDLTGWFIEDGTGSVHGNGGGDTSLDGLVIPAGGYLLLTQGVEFNFILNIGGDAIVLSDDLGFIVDEITYGNFDDGDVGDNEQVPAQDKSLGRQHEGSIKWVEFDIPTPGATNGNGNSVPELINPNYETEREATEDVAIEDNWDNDLQFIDQDGDELTYSLSAAPQGMTVEKEDNEDINIVWESPVKGTYENIILSADDGINKTEVKFNLTVEPFLELEITQITPGTEVNPGDQVTVKGTYTNNGDSALIKVNLLSEADMTITELPFEDSDWWLSIAGTENFELTFTVPEITDDDTFDLITSIDGLSAWGNSYDDKNTTKFNITKEPFAVVISSATLENEELSCTQETGLELEIVNKGEEDILEPYILVYERTVDENSFDEDGKNFTKFANGNDAQPLLKEELSDITPSTSNALVKDLDLDLTELSSGVYTLQVYLISPAFGNNNFIADKKTVDVTINNCNPLQIEETKVKVGSDTYTDLIDAAPGDEVEVTITFGNDGQGTIGHVKLEAEVTDNNLDFFPYTAECNGAECDQGQWTLLDGEKREHSFTFTLPSDVTGSFDMTVQVLDELVDGSKQESEVKTLVFNVIKDDANIVIKESTIDDKSLTCARVTTLNLDLINSGDNPVAPEVLVYSKEPSQGSFDEDDGEFVFSEEPLVSEEYTFSGKINTADTKTAQVAINTTNLAEGQHTLYVYVVSPFFTNGENHYFVSDETSVEISVGACLNWEAIEEKLKAVKNFIDEKEVNFFEINQETGEYVFIYENTDLGYENILSFQIAEDNEEEGIVGQSNPEIVSCNMDPAKTEISCNPPEEDQSGTSTLTMDIVQDLGAGEANKITEYFDVVIDNTLGISNVKINGDLIEEGETSAALNPYQEIEVKLTVTNHLDYPVTGVVASLVTNGIDIKSEETINLEAKQSKEISFKDQLSYLLTKGEYKAELTVSGVDYENNVVENDKDDKFEFTFNLEQEAADLVISKLTVDEEELAELAEDDWEGFTCNPTATVTMELTNKGTNSEDDVVVTVNGADVEMEFDLKEVDEDGNGEISPNTQDTYSVEVPTRDLNSGSNTVKFEITYRDGYKSDSEILAITKNDCFKEAQSKGETDEEWEVDETDDPWILADEEKMEMKVVLNEDLTGKDYTFEDIVSWYILGENNEEPVASGEVYPFSKDTAKDEPYEIVADVNGEKFSWFVTVTDKPFSNELTTNIAEDDTKVELGSFENFTVENAYGKIVFSEANLNALFNLDEVIKISDGLVAVDTVKAPELNVPAIVTLKKEYEKQIIFVAEGFDKEDAEYLPCVEEICQQIDYSQEDGFIFTVEEFSTYKVLEDVDADFSVSAILVDNSDRGDNVTVDVIVTNSGSLDKITDITVELDGVDGDYEAKIDTTEVAELVSQQSFTVKLEFTIPEDEDAGEHSIGSLKVTGKNGEEELTKSSSIKINPKSHLLIESFKVNGKTTGKLNVDEENTIKIKVKNDYSEDLEDVFVTVTILDVDGDDLEEESEEIDLDDGKDEWLEVTFDLSNEDLEDDTYTVEVIAEGVAADDDSEHETITTEEVDVDREDHKVVIKDLDLSASVVQCPTRHSTLEVTVENVGKKNEDVEVTIKNSALGLDEMKKMELDKYSGDDTKDEVKFFLDSYLANAAAQSYPITIEVEYDKGDETESDEVMIEVIDCALTQNNASQQQNQLADALLAQQLQQQLQQQMNAQKTQQSVPASTVKTSFRESSSYTLLLGVLVILVLIAIMLAFAVIMKKK